MIRKTLQGLLWGSALALLPFPATAEISCTATPDCASLGYTKSAADCPSGGVRCPFNSNLMFCIKNTTAYNFQLTVPTALYNTVFHDGTTSTVASAAGKIPIGIVYYLYPKSSSKHGLLMSIEQPLVDTWQNAVDYCNNFSVKGTNPGDWRLPSLWEMLVMGDVQSLGSYPDQNKPYTLNTKLFAIKGADPLSWSGSTQYYNGSSFSFNGGTLPLYFDTVRKSLIDYNSSYTSGNSADYPGSYTYGSYGQYFGSMSQPNYWTISDYPPSTGNAYYVRLRHVISSSTVWDNYAAHAAKSSYGHFRCIMSF